MGRTLTGKAIYPAADYRPVPGWETTGVLTDTENLKLVWHKTQGSSDPYEWYKQSGGVPHLTLQRDGTLDQHYFFSHFSRALKNLAGGIETNRECIQVEVVGWVGTEATDAQLETIVALIQWCNGTLGIPTVWPLGRPRGAADHGPHRDSVFDHTAGQYGHSQVGEQDHTDPCWTDRGRTPVSGRLARIFERRRLLHGGHRFDRQRSDLASAREVRTKDLPQRPKPGLPARPEIVGCASQPSQRLTHAGEPLHRDRVKNNETA